MKPSETAKGVGLSSLKEMTELAGDGFSEQKLIRLHKKCRESFAVLAMGCLVRKYRLSGEVRRLSKTDTYKFHDPIDAAQSELNKESE